MWFLWDALGLSCKYIVFLIKSWWVVVNFENLEQLNEYTCEASVQEFKFDLKKVVDSLFFTLLTLVSFNNNYL